MQAVFGTQAIGRNAGRCSGEGGDRRDECLVRLVFKQEDVALCAEIPESRCSAIGGTALMQRCADLPIDQLLICEVAVAQEPGAVEACDVASEPTGCVAAVAANRMDLQNILGHLRDPQARDMAIALNATELRDLRAIDLIEDNHALDLALVAIVSSIGIGLSEVIDPARCNRLRGGYEDASVGRDEEGAVRRLCGWAVELSNFAVMRQNMAETDQERAAFVSMFRELVGALERGEVTFDELSAPTGTNDPSD
ncbi:MAG: hypothetical protein WEB63_02735 [Cucumibacter sp.]